jgi:glutathione S-transferase
MKLYYSPGACSLSPHMVLREAGIDFTLEKVDLKTKKTEAGADYLKVNPNGYVPALQLDDGTVLTEGPAIVQYLADRAPGAKLAPANGTIERYRLQEALNFISTELHKQFSPLFDPAAPEDLRKAQVERIGRRFDFVEKRLSAKPFWLGEAFTVADAYLFTIVNWSAFVKIDLSKWPRLKEYRKRIAERPSTQAALKAEGLLK